MSNKELFMYIGLAGLIGYLFWEATKKKKVVVRDKKTGGIRITYPPDVQPTEEVVVTSVTEGQIPKPVAPPLIPPT